MKFYFLVLLVIPFILAASPAEALTVSPVKAELSADPGQKVTGELTLLNEQNETITFYSSFENFEPQGESGTPNFVPGQEGLATWIKAASSITLKPQEKEVIPFSIDVPANAEPGGHFAAIFWSANPPATQATDQVAVGAKIGTLVLLKVSGDIKEGGAILDFSSQDKKTWFTALPVTFVYRFQNGGGDRVKPLGAVTIKNVFGGTSAVINANPSEGNVLPASTRKFTLEWVGNGKPVGDGTGFFAMAKAQWDNFALGSYAAVLHLNYGGSNEAETSFHLFVFPWQLLSIVAAALLVILAILVIGIRKYNSWIIKRATGR